jgi:hypothetical protein
MFWTLKLHEFLCFVFQYQYVLQGSLMNADTSTVERSHKNLKEVDIKTK